LFGTFSVVAVYLLVVGASPPTIDGDYKEDEWSMMKHYNYPFWLDVNNTIDPECGIANVDGWNYISVGADDNYYYIGLDLCSDRTNNTNGEWIAYYLANRLPEFGMTGYSANFPMHAMRDAGGEWIDYDVENESEFNRSIDIKPFNVYHGDIPIVEPHDNVTLRSGSTTDGYTEYWTSDDINYTMKSETGSDIYNGIAGIMTGEQVTWEIAINVSSKFPRGYESLFLGNMTTLDVDIEIGGNLTSVDHLMFSQNTTADEIVVWLQANTMYKNVSDPTFVNGANGHWVPFNANDESIHSLTFNPSIVNSTTGMLYLTLVCYNELNSTNATAFEIYVDKFTLAMNTRGYGDYHDTTVNSSNYDLAWSFGTSPNCGVLHRMFELRVSRSEFPVTTNDELYLFIAGYGTMAFEDVDYWIYPYSLDGMFSAFEFGMPVANDQFALFGLE
jgi:hypothetical protein